MTMPALTTRFVNILSYVVFLSASSSVRRNRKTSTQVDGYSVGMGVRATARELGQRRKVTPMLIKMFPNHLLLELLVRASDLAIRIRWAAFPVVS